MSSRWELCDDCEAQGREAVMSDCDACNRRNGYYPESKKPFTKKDMKELQDSFQIRPEIDWRDHQWNNRLFWHQGDAEKARAKFEFNFAFPEWRRQGDSSHYAYLNKDRIVAEWIAREDPIRLEFSCLKAWAEEFGIEGGQSPDRVTGVLRMSPTYSEPL